MENRAIVHMDLDSFFVSCERLQNPSLNNKPIIVGGDTERGVVSSCSYEARKFGVTSAMSIQKAKKLCPEAIIVSSGFGLYSKYSAMVTEIIRESVPIFEKSSIDEFYIDLTGTDKFFGAYKIASNLRQQIIKETGLPISFGFSTNKTVSKIATGEAKPNNQLKIEPGNEKAFLAPLKIEKIPFLGAKASEVLHKMGIFFIKDIQKMQQETLEARFGKMGSMIWFKANGIDNSKVGLHYERKSISAERTYSKDTNDIQKIKTTLTTLTENITYQLRTKRKVANCVAIKIRYQNFENQSIQRKIDATDNDFIILKHVFELFDELYVKNKFVRLIGVRLSGISGKDYQINLFEQDERADKLHQSIDNLRNKYGSTIVSRANTMGEKVYNFNPFGKQT